MDAILFRYLPSLYGRAFRDLGNAADAEDAVQDAWLSAFGHLGQFRGEAQLSTWLTAIVTNAARMQIRRRGSRTSVSLDEKGREQDCYSLSERLQDRGPSPEEAFRRSEHSAHLTHLARLLSATLRRAFELRELDGLTIREMTNVLSVSENTVKTRILGARVKIRGLM